MIAFVFPGQGSQSVGMGREIYNEFAIATEYLDAFDEEAEFPLLLIMFEGPNERLTATENAQPALAAHSLTVAQILRKEGIVPDIVAGHSLGEYSALAVAKTFNPFDTIDIVRQRGQFMAEAGTRLGGTMAAVIGLDAQKVEEAVASVDVGDAVVANYNSPGQTVISGNEDAVEAAGKVAGEMGAKRVIPLNVSGAFHSPLMQQAADRLAEVLADTAMDDAELPVVTNVLAVPEQRAAALRTGLVKQLTEPVRWVQSVEKMLEMGVDTFVEVGPGRVLSKMLQRSGVAADVYSTGSVDEIRQVINDLG
ncbi:MAG: ACP S-malonyltransferase [Armatimonadota bacterium]